MNSCLVGYTGFVGSNIASKFKFDKLYNSKNIQEAFGKKTDLLVYSGVRAEKFLANSEPEKDFEIIKNAFENIKKINPKYVVLISTIDVYKNPVDVDEDTAIDTDNLQPYGFNRYQLEKMVANEFEQHTIVRLPGLFGENIKKNFIYDLINVIPSMLHEEKFKQLCCKDNLIKDYYIRQENGFYKCKQLAEVDREQLKEYFNKIGFSALNFTDSRGRFQFYNLDYLAEHIKIAVENNVKLLNIAVEPLSVKEIHKTIKGSDFVNEVAKVIPKYDYKTKYAEIFGGKDGYIFDKRVILDDIKKFVYQK